MTTTQSPAKPTTVFKNWLVSQGSGAGFHPDVDYSPDGSGGHVLRASKNLPMDSVIVTLPFSRAITPSIAKDALARVCGDPGALDGLSERQLVCTYVCAHWALDLAPLENFTSMTTSHIDADTRVPFTHGPYISTLPQPSTLLTPLHWSESEIALTQGTNLFRATLNRRSDWEQELTSLQAALTAASIHPVIFGALTWLTYLTACTYLSSRAFPSTLLSPMPSLISTPTSHPVLLPGIDAANHARGARVSWSVSSPGSSSALPSTETVTTEAVNTLSISLITHDPISQGTEIFNNYGPKPNAELVLGYGFALPSNPDDTIVLLVGGSSTPGFRNKHEVGRGAKGAESILAEVRRAMLDGGAEDEEDEMDAWETDLDAAECLGEMTTSVLEALPSDAALAVESVRPAVLQMMKYYVEGQREVLNDLIEFAEKKRKAAYSRAKAAGVTVVERDEEDEDKGKPDI